MKSKLSISSVCVIKHSTNWSLCTLCIFMFPVSCLKCCEETFLRFLWLTQSEQNWTTTKCRCHLWLVKEDHCKEILVGQLNLALHLSILLSKRVRDGLEKNTGLNEIVQCQALLCHWVISEDDQLCKLWCHSISHLVECYKSEFLHSYNTPFNILSYAYNQVFKTPSIATDEYSNIFCIL